MKQLLLSALLLTTPVFAGTIYCPQSIVCVNGACHEIPKNFYVSTGSLLANTMYMFKSAHSVQGSKKPVKDICTYESVSGVKTSTVLLGYRKKIEANTNVADHQWVATPGVVGGFTCEHNATSCPFKS